MSIGSSTAAGAAAGSVVPGVGTLVGAGVGLLTGGVKALLARKQGKQQKRLIRDAYNVAQPRLTIAQGDQSQAQGEALTSRGIASGVAAPIGPNANASVTGAHSLGEQQNADLRREQGYEQTDLLRQRDQAIQGVKSQTQQAYIDAAAQGIGTGVSAANAVNTARASRSPIQSAMQVTGSEALPNASPYPGSFGGIDPIRPLDRGSWAGMQNSDFNVTG